MQPHSPLYLPDAAIGLPHSAASLPDAPEPFVLGMVDTTLARSGPRGLYEIAWQVGMTIVRSTRSLSIHVAMSPRMEMRTTVHAFLCALVDELHGQAPARECSAQLFRRVFQASEHDARKLMCSLLWIARSVRNGIRRATTA